MRILASVLVLLLMAGCTAPTDDKDKEDPLFGLCPQWTQGGGSQSSGFHLPSGNSTNRTHEVELGPAPAEHGGFPLDMYRITLTNLTVDGRLELRAFDANGLQLAIRDYRPVTPRSAPVLVFDDGSAVDHEVEVFLSPITEDGPGSPAPVTLRWTLDGADAVVGFDVTYHYKVCGAAA